MTKRERASVGRERSEGTTRRAVPMPDLAAIDLNLLVAFEALHTERSVTRAGRRLGLSQPATSGALARLREMLSDELFVRGKDGLVPTERCAELAPPIARALLDLRAALTGGTFDPKTTTRTFTIAGVDAVLGVLAPPLLAAIHEAAPSARVVVLPIDPNDAIAHAEEGTIDLALAPVTTLPTTVGARELFEVTGVLAMRPGHPLAKGPAAKRPLAKGPLAKGKSEPVITLEDLTRFPQIMVSFVGSSRSAIDDLLAREGKKRHVAFVVTSFLAVPHVLAETDALAVLPAPFAKKLVAQGMISTAPLPAGVPFPSLRMRMIWPLAHDAAPASKWLRDLVIQIAKRTV
ncbi:MAG: LysR family transcriptional regulator [Deltaproteobacteria bacterium]|nr:LysR family transcriptional regulator [Deltaproteobacteria bacterium]